MKTLFPSIASFLLLFVFGLTSIAVTAQESEGVFVISGVVKDQKSKRALEYVNVTVPGSNVGTITNSDGFFSLKIKKNKNTPFIEISHIGYQTSRLPIGQENIDEKVLFLSPGIIRLNEVVIKPVDARQVIDQALSAIRVNYNRYPAMHKGFYRETSQKKRKYITISEAVIDVYKTAYTENVDKDRVRIFKGRQLLSQRQGDTLAVKLIGGPTLATFLDMVKNPDVLLSRDCLDYYKYEFTEYAMIDNRMHYTIRFSPQVVTDDPLYTGTLYIDRENFAITRLEFNLDMRDKMKVTRMILRHKPAGLMFKPVSISYLVTYRQQEGRTYLNYIRNEIKFNADWKKKWFSTTYTVTSEMVITDRQDNPPGSIPYKETFKSTQVLSDKVMNFYDENFWEDYNIIEPTESLDNAVKKLKKTQGQALSLK
ncbi:MAG: carboxypeptidase-like regulatory domain-containing protein [Bacteroides sp.]